MVMARNTDFEVGIHYHIYNRGTEKRPIFLEKGDIFYFLNALIISNSPDRKLHTNAKGVLELAKQQALQSENLVEIVAYALLPNHFHLILKEIIPGGISKFMQKLGTSYTMYFNKKYKRTGVLFQGKFKGKEVEDVHLDYLSAYVNTNYAHHGYDPKKDLVKTSQFEYLNIEKGDYICNKAIIGEIVRSYGSAEAYKKHIMSLSETFIERHGLSPKEHLDKLDLDDTEYRYF